MTAFWGLPRHGEQRIYAFRTQADEKVCDECASLENHEFVCEEGEDLTRYFPYAEIWDEELDSWRANVHLNCRCWLELVDVNREEV
ncbi:MAG: hypothetical protein QXN95_00290 [Candidatus Bathyarchaeia archaeon]